MKNDVKRGDGVKRGHTPITYYVVTLLLLIIVLRLLPLMRQLPIIRRRRLYYVIAIIYAIEYVSRLFIDAPPNWRC